MDLSDDQAFSAAYAPGICCRANPRLNRATPYQWHFKLSATSRRRSFVEFKAGRLVAVLQRHVDALHVTLKRLSRLQQRGPEQDGDLEVFGAT